MLVTGGARGQGRSHAIAFAQEGARVILTDTLENIASLSRYPRTSQQDMDETVKAINQAVGERFVERPASRGGWLSRT